MNHIKTIQAPTHGVRGANSFDNSATRKAIFLILLANGFTDLPPYDVGGPSSSLLLFFMFTNGADRHILN